ncbi:MAG TPA: hypothetical protein VMZ28_12830 [Kofleriaceae bacterium]|nr:hypothetical protein [Kofleriaceae bacterium]
MRAGRHAGALLVVLVAWPAAVRAQPTACRPVARVGGEPALAAAVVPLLEERGVPLAGAAPACGVVDAVLTTQDGRVRVTIIDADGATVERSADDAPAAATAIESFVRSDVSEPLLAARAAPPAPRQTGDHEPPPVTAVAAPIAAAPGGAGRAIDVAGAAEVGVTGDGAVWRGARLQGCVRVGRVCAGGLLRVADDSESRGDSADLLTSRMAFELAFLAELPLRAGGRVTLVPGVRAGVLSVTAERETLLQGESEDETYAAHVGAGVAAAVALRGAWSLRADVAVGYSPFPRTVLGARKRAGEPDERLAGAEQLHAWLGLGLGYGGL